MSQWPPPDAQWRPVSAPPRPRPARRWVPILVLLVMAMVVNGAVALRGPWFNTGPQPVPPAPSATTSVSTEPVPSEPAPSQPSPATPSPATPSIDTPSAIESTPTRPTSSKPVPTKAPDLKTLSRGVVLIKGETPAGISNGTGMVIASSGLVVTNYHVVQGSETVKVRTNTSKVSYEATVLGADPVRDVALLQLQGAGKLPTVTFDPDPLAVGDPLIQVGNSGGQGYLDQARGVVTKLDTSVTVDNPLSPEGRSTITGVVASNTAAVPGDSGGPMFDIEGQVVGMTTAGNQKRAKTQGATTTYHVPWPTVLQVADQIRNGAGNGTIRVGGRAYLGVTLADTSLKIVSVVPAGPAAKAKVPVGATITYVSSTPVKTRPDLYQALLSMRPGQTITLGYDTPAGYPRTAQVTLGTNPAN